MMILIIATQLFAVRTGSGLTGAVTQPTALISPQGSYVDFSYYGGNAEPFLNMLDVDKDLVSINYTLAEEGIGEFSLVTNHRGSSSNYGINTKLQFPTGQKLKTAIGGGATLYQYDASNLKGLKTSLFDITSYSYYGATSYAIANDLNISLNARYLGMTVRHGGSVNTSTYGLAATYKLDKFDLAADYMAFISDNDSSSWGAKVVYNVNDRFGIGIGVINESDTSLFGNLSYKLK